MLLLIVLVLVIFSGLAGLFLIKEEEGLKIASGVVVIFGFILFLGSLMAIGTNRSMDNDRILDRRELASRYEYMKKGEPMEEIRKAETLIQVRTWNNWLVEVKRNNKEWDLWHPDEVEGLEEIK